MADISLNVETGYSASNPHPGHGIDPNIMNELGHTHYPKFVDHPTEKRVDHVVTTKKNGDSESHSIETKFPLRVLVKDADEEAELLGTASAAKPKKGEKGWGDK